MVPGHPDSKALIAGLVQDVPDFPTPGVVFKDITPLLASPGGFSAAVIELVNASPRPEQVDVVVGMEARGFIFAAPVALAMGAGFVPVRKPGKLPRDVVTETFALEYGTATLAVHSDAIQPGARVLIVDDVLATGGTIVATAKILRQLQAQIVGISVLMELDFLGGQRVLEENGLPRASSVLQA